MEDAFGVFGSRRLETIDGFNVVQSRKCVIVVLSGWLMCDLFPTIKAVTEGVFVCSRCVTAIDRCRPCRVCVYKGGDRPASRLYVTRLRAGRSGARPYVMRVCVRVSDRSNNSGVITRLCGRRWMCRFDSDSDSDCESIPCPHWNFDCCCYRNNCCCC